MTLRSGERSRTLTAVVGGDEVSRPRLTAVDLAGLVPAAAPESVWLWLADDADQAAAFDGFTDLAGAAVPAAQVFGLASERAAIDFAPDVLVAGVAAVLGVLLGGPYGLVGAAPVAAIAG